MADSSNEPDRGEWKKLFDFQRLILPQTPPQVRGYRQVLVYCPSFVVTADYHDYFRRTDGRTAIFVGDGSGHGPAASMLMAMMYTIFRTHPDLHRQPGETLSRAGRMMHHLIPSDRFMTGVYLLLGDEGHVSWSAAGNHPPLRINRDGRLFPIDLGPTGLVLGTEPEEQYVTVEWRLDAGERLLLFTDGIWEACSRTGEAFGVRRLCTHLAESASLPLEEAVRQLVGNVQAHMENSDFEDDYTLIGIERID